MAARRLAVGDSLRLMPALVALKNANFGTVLFDRIWRASGQMGIAAAFDAAKRPNKSLFLDDEGTLFHSPAPNPPTVALNAVRQRARNLDGRRSFL
jgi:hypothetical protein